MIVEEMQKDGIVEFIGYQKIIHPFYKNASAALMPSYHEGMSNVLLEAAATGRPALATDINGCKEAVEDGKTGLLFEPRSGQALEEAIEAFVNMSAAEREQMGKNARAKMEQEFDRKHVVMAYIEEIKSVC